jgi:hypothetical protein
MTCVLLPILWRFPFCNGMNACLSRRVHWMFLLFNRVSAEHGGVWSRKYFPGIIVAQPPCPRQAGMASQLSCQILHKFLSTASSIRPRAEKENEEA